MAGFQLCGCRVGQGPSPSLCFQDTAAVLKQLLHIGPQGAVANGSEAAAIKPVSRYWPCFHKLLLAFTEEQNLQGQKQSAHRQQCFGANEAEPPGSAALGCCHIHFQGS